MALGLMLEHIMEGSVIIYLIFPSNFMRRTDLSSCCLLSSEYIRLRRWKKKKKSNAVWVIVQYIECKMDHNLA